MSHRRRLLWTALVLTVIGSCVVVIVPVWHVQPFRPQSAEGMSWSYALRREGPLMTTVALAVAVILAVTLWVGARARAARAALAILIALGVGAAWFVRQNHFEWMFTPVGNAVYVPVEDASFVADADMVMGVAIGGVSVAYPVRQLAFHHLVNTEVGGAPLVATY